MTTPDLAALQAEVTTEFPNFSIVQKNTSKLMKFIAVFLTAMFMTDFVTTINDTMYVPSIWETWSEQERCVILRHERIHMRQARRLTFPLFGFLYLCVFFPIGLAYFRAKFEMEAYAESLAAMKDYGATYADSGTRDWLLSMFTSNAYGWMWPFPSSINVWFDATVAALEA